MARRGEVVRGRTGEDEIGMVWQGKERQAWGGMFGASSRATECYGW